LPVREATRTPSDADEINVLTHRVDLPSASAGCGRMVHNL
jgi:hypothetical protein